MKRQRHVYHGLGLFILLVTIFILSNILNEGITGQTIATTVEFGGEELVKVNETLEEVTRNDAILAIETAKSDITEMEEAGFGIVYVNDQLIAAEKALDRADYAQVLQTRTTTNALVKEARTALEGLDWQGFTFAEVLTYTNKISERKSQAYDLSDYITVLDLKLTDYQETGVDTTVAEKLLTSTKTAFTNERYEETQELIDETNTELNNRAAEMTSVRAVTRASRTYIERNLWQMILLSILLIFGASFGYKQFVRWRAKSRLEHVTIEKKTLRELMKKAQTERFVDGKLSDSIYKIRMDKYRERVAQIKSELPVLRSILKGKKKRSFVHKDRSLPRSYGKRLRKLQIRKKVKRK
jgi:hypothetical protein